MSESDNVERLRERFGKRIQRCPGCFVAYYLRDMWLSADAMFFCEDCKDDSMFHFDDFSTQLDLSKLPSLQEEQ